MSSPHSNITDVVTAAFEQYAGDLFRHCRYRRFSHEDAEEIVQETFLHVWEYLSNGHSVENLRAFTFRVANNLIVDKVRKDKTEKKVSLEELQEQGIDWRNMQNEKRDLEKRIEAGKLLQELKAKGEKEDHKLLSLRYLQGLMPSDIASKMGISSNVISVRLHRALKKAYSLSLFS